MTPASDVAGDLALTWLCRTLAALAPAIRSLPDMVAVSPELLLDMERTAEGVQRLAAFLGNGGAPV